MDVKEDKDYFHSKTPHPPLVGSPKASKNSSEDRHRKKAGSPEPNCAICLGRLQNRSVTDSCLHKFCFTCLLEWSKVKAECPLCKSKFTSIIHNIRSDNDFEEYTLPPPPPPDPPQAPPHGGENQDQRFIVELHRSLFMPGRFRFNLPTFHIGPQLNGGISSNGSAWRRRRGNASNEFRKSIYERNLWVDPQSLVDITGRYRECSPDWYRNNPAQTHRLVPWLNRELSVLLNRDMDRVSYVLNSILELISNYDILSRDFHHSLSEHLGQRTSHFCHEFYHYARSVYDLVGYDRNAVHIQRPPNSRMPTDSDGEDVIFVDEVRTGEGAVSGHDQGTESLNSDRILDENTPSTSGGETSQGKPRLVVPVDSSESSEDENIEIVDVLPPRHERTPELVLLSTDEDSPGPRSKMLTTTIVVSSEGESQSEVNSSSSLANTRSQKKRSKKRARLNSKLSSSIQNGSVQSSKASSQKFLSHRRSVKLKKGKGPGKKSSTTTTCAGSPSQTPESSESTLSSSSSCPEDGGISARSSETSINKRKCIDRKRKRKRKRRSGTTPAAGESSSSESSNSSRVLQKKSSRSLALNESNNDD